MRRLYLTRLAISFRTIDKDALQSERQRSIYASVAAVVGPGPSPAPPSNLEWNEIYEVERLIALLLAGAPLRQEIAGRIQGLSAESAAAAANFQREYELLLKPAGQAPKTPPDDDLLRGFLLRVLEALQWRANERHLAQPIRKKAVKNILGCLLVAFALLVVPYIYLNVDFAADAMGGAPLAEPSSTALAPSGSASDAAPIGIPSGDASGAAPAAAGEQTISKWWSLFALWTALTAGLLGAFFSRLLSVQRTRMSLDDAFMHREVSYSLLRAGVGVCGALIVYIFLRSGIVEGALFPDFSQVAIEWVKPPKDTVPMTFVMPSKALALLTFWCFIAGFSEALVPRILGNAERQLGNAATPTPAQP